MAILLFREAFGTDYRDTVAHLDLTGRIKALLRLDQVPPLSTLHKFMARMSPSFHENPETNPYTVSFPGRKYSDNRHRLLQDSPVRTSASTTRGGLGKMRKTFLKTSIAVDTRKQVILVGKISHKPVMTFHAKLPIGQT